jgi:2-polyprenyl-3-methyl-5-hydroxy-6-metoxy-1,4-benzoquinol methylase
MHQMWDERYGGSSYAYGTEPNEFLVSSAPFLNPKSKVLCIADGEGRNSVWLASLGHSVTAVDISTVGLAKCRKLATEKGVDDLISTVHADLSEYSFSPESYDAIISIFCHLMPSLRVTVHRNCVQALKRGGIIILEAYTPQQLSKGTGGPRERDLLMTAEDLSHDFQGTDVIRLDEKERDVYEGLYHTGHSSVVQLIAKKI